MLPHSSSVVPNDAVSEEKDDDNGIKIEIGRFYSVRRTNGQEHTGRVLHKRTMGKSKQIIEYYVHYLGLNRRLDEWVKKHRISERDSTLTSEELSGKIRALVVKDDKNSEPLDRKVVPALKRRNEDAPNALNMELEKEHETLTKVKFINNIVLGTFLIDAWYYSPYPDEYEKVPTIHVCQYCLKYMQYMDTYSLHRSKCKAQPPGKKIYQDGNLAIYEIDGGKSQLYCQLLCLMAKLFLDHKTLFYDTEPFLFYVLFEIRNDRKNILGYFSKEKESPHNNVACILILPPYQRKGYGKLLIAYSYELSRRDGVIGSPENPLSDLGRLSYRGYWANTLLEILNVCETVTITIKELSEISGITVADIHYTLKSLKMLKYWNGKRSICVTREIVARYLTFPLFRRPKITIKYEKLGWVRRERIPSQEEIEIPEDDEINDPELPSTSQKQPKTTQPSQEAAIAQAAAPEAAVAKPKNI